MISILSQSYPSKVEADDAMRRMSYPAMEVFRKGSRWYIRYTI